MGRGEECDEAQNEERCTRSGIYERRTPTTRMRVSPKRPESCRQQLFVRLDQAQKPQRAIGLPAEVSGRGGNVLRSGQAQEADRHVAQ